ncbi:10656_t:CDS:2, partial [Diversispora eburnea]
LELVNTRETLRVTEAWNIGNESNSEEDSDENSQDSNTSDLNMTIIPELADAIEGYLDNTRINRTILVNQIKRATGQIRHLRRIARLVKMTPEQTREQWLRGLSPMNQNNIRQGGIFFLSMDEQLKNLSELEAYTFSQGNTSHQIIQQPFQQNPTFDQFKSELEKERSIFKAELSKRDAKHKADMEKLESILQQQKVQAPVPQTVEPQKDNARLEEKVDEIGNILSRLNIDKQPQKPVAKSNRTQRYYPFQPINSSVSANEEGNEGGYDEEKGESQGDIIPRIYDQLLLSLSPAMQRICKFSFTTKKSEMNCPMDSEKTNEWFESLQYLVCYVCDLTIYNTYLNLGSEFNVVNNAFGEALGWKPDLPFDFQYKGNSEHVDKSLGWYTDVLISLKDKEGKTITVTGNFARIDDVEPEPMICLDIEISLSELAKDVFQSFGDGLLASNRMI